MKILVIGAGMYVTGRGETGPGTVLSSLAQTSTTLPIEEVVVVATNAENAKVVAQASERINSIIGTNLRVRYRAVQGVPEEAVGKLCAEEKFHGAVVAVPDDLHYAYAKALLMHRVHCLVVKPLTPGLQEAKDLEELRKAQRLYGAVEFHKRWDPTNLWMRRTLQESALGRVSYINVDYSQRITIPTTTFRDWARRTNIFQYLGVHYVDLIWFLTGFLPVRAMAIGTYGVLQEQGVSTWDSIHAKLIWRNPVNQADWFVSNLSTNWIDPACTSAMSDQKYCVVGTRGRVMCDQKNRGLELVHESSGIQQINPFFAEYLPRAGSGMAFGGYGHESINQFICDVAAIEDERMDSAQLQAIRPTFREALVSSAILEAVNRSLTTNSSWMEISDPF